MPWMDSFVSIKYGKGFRWSNLENCRSLFLQISVGVCQTRVCSGDSHVMSSRFGAKPCTRPGRSPTRSRTTVVRRRGPAFLGSAMAGKHPREVAIS